MQFYNEQKHCLWPSQHSKNSQNKTDQNSEGSYAYICIIYICIYFSLPPHTHTYIFLPLTLFPILGPYIPLSLGLLTLFLSVSTSLIFSDSVYASSGSHFVAYSVSLSPFPSLAASWSVYLWVIFFIPSCLVFLTTYLSLFYYVNLSLFPYRHSLNSVQSNSILIYSIFIEKLFLKSLANPLCMLRQGGALFSLFSSRLCMDFLDHPAEEVQPALSTPLHPGS